MEAEQSISGSLQMPSGWKFASLKLVIFTAFIVTAFIVASRPSQVPTFQGKTAYQWFDHWTRNPKSDEFRLAIQNLNTNFIPVFVAILSKRNPPLGTEYNDLYILMPQLVRHLLPPPVSLSSKRLAAFDALDELLRHDPSSLNQLKAAESLFHTLLKTGEEEISHRALVKLWELETGDPSDNSTGENFLTHPDFIIRFHSAQKFEASLEKHERHRAKICVPVLLEALTNSVLAQNTFGENEPIHLQTAARMLLRIDKAAASTIPSELLQ